MPPVGAKFMQPREGKLQNKLKRRHYSDNSSNNNSRHSKLRPLLEVR